MSIPMVNQKIQISEYLWVDPPKLSIGLYCVISKNNDDFCGVYVTGVKYSMVSNNWVYQLTIRGESRTYFYEDIHPTLDLIL